MGQLIAHLRRYLLLVANQELSPALRRKVGPSDLVQETFVQLQHNLGQFRGGTEQELRAWVRKILINGIHDVERRYRAGVRDVQREQPLAGDSVAGILPSEPQTETPGPRSNAIQRERSEDLQRAISRLPDEYREVLRLRTWERLSFAEVGQRMNRSPDAVRMLWKRAVQRLQEQMESENDLS
jgi:RNA polymerase sigma-70 factor (ECF subfamily)